MKAAFTLLLATLVVSVSAGSSKKSQNPVENIPLNDDFLVGFETGIFLRKTPEQIEEYSCPKASIKMDEFVKVKEMFPAVAQILKTMNSNDEVMMHMMESLQVFIDHVDELVGVFENDYNGGDFCSGLKFGFNGSNLLFKIAEATIHHTIQQMKAAEDAKAGGKTNL